MILSEWLGGPGRGKFIVPFSGNHLECFGLLGFRSFLSFGDCSGVDALFEKRSCLCSLLSGFVEAGLGVRSKAEELFRTPKAIFQAPKFSAGGGNQQVKTTAIEQLGFFSDALAAFI